MRRRRTTTYSTWTMIAVILIAVLYFGYQELSKPAPSTPGPANPPAQSSASSGVPTSWLTVYFTDPNPPDNLGHGIDQNVKPVLDAATKTIDVTSFDLNLPDLMNALIAAQKRGVKVRVVYDGENGNHDLENAATGNKPYDAVPALKGAGVSLVDGGRSNGLMHDKIVIVDGKTLFMGSWNLSYNDTYRNNNNLLKIADSTLIANYQAKFNELFIEKKFGTHAEVKAKTSSMTIEGTPVENFFSPPDGVMAKLVSYVQGAKKSVHMMIFTFTDDGLAKAMIARQKAGLDVQAVIENRGASQGAMVDLFCAKVPVKIDGNKYTMHHKVIIIDGETVITGSYNFTKSADTVNDDNALIIHNTSVAALYEAEYQKISNLGESPKAADITCPK